jgi:transposase
MVTSMMIAVDLASRVFELAVANERYRIIERHRLSRDQFLKFFVQREPCEVVMEACGTAHHWARELQKLGFAVRLLPAQYVGAYRRRNKTDRADCEAILEAARNPEILPVPIKSAEQQAVQALHRMRSQWMSARTARINVLRGLLREQGILLPPGSRAALNAAPLALDDEKVPLVLRRALLMLIGESHALEERVEFIERELKTVAAQSEAVAQLMQVPGIGLLGATALAASAGAPQHFRSGRHLAAWLGLTPREHSSGNRRHLGAISKRGDVYVRTLLVHGARSVLLRAKLLARQGAPLNRLQAWAVSLEQRVGHNKAACALANKLARIGWAIWSRGGSFDPDGAMPALAA